MILNVDDHEPGRYARSRLLKQAGYEVAEAGTGLAALEMAGLMRPALIMLDVHLPDVSGLEVCRRLRSDPHLRSTPILQISASAIGPEDRTKGLDNGADAYLIEPVDSDVLLATIRALLRMRKAEAALEKANEALVAANERLIQTNHDLQNFAHATSHDLKEPLRTISCFAELFERKYHGRFDKNGEEMLTTIQKAASRMGALIDGVLSYAESWQAGEDEHNDVDLSRVVAEAIRNLEQSIKEGGAVVTCGPLPTVRGNPSSLCQLFQNLIHNALKYHRPEEPARVTLSDVSKAGSTKEVVVTDNGLGIKPEHLTLVFAPFQRLHSSAVTGSGIGLATCQRIMERHDGRIWAESKGLGHGSTFHLLFR